MGEVEMMKRSELHGEVVLLDRLDLISNLLKVLSKRM